MKITSLRESQIEELKPLIATVSFKPHEEYKIDHNLLTNNLVNEIVHMLSQKTTDIIVAEDNDDIVGMCCSERLDWDSKHFGLEMARIRYLMAKGEYSSSVDTKNRLLSAMFERYQERGYNHVTARVHSEDISSVHALENKGFNLMDTLVTYSFDFRKQPIAEIEDQCTIGEFKASDIPALLTISRRCFSESRVVTSRFDADPSLPQVKCVDLYEKWVDEACRGSVDFLLVAEVDGVPVGFTTCKIQNSANNNQGLKFGGMILSAVSPHARQKGIYTSMINGGLKWFRGKADIVEVGTQVGNYSVQKAWSRLGFRISRSQYTFHKPLN